MSVLTENDVRKMLASGQIKEKSEVVIARNRIITPSARAYLLEKGIEIKIEDDPVREVVDVDTEDVVVEEEYETLFGAKLKEKPEHMTHLGGNLLVFKDHPRIAFRGAIDSLEAEIIMAQIFAQKQQLSQMIKDLEEIIKFIRKLLRCEVTGEVVGEFKEAEIIMAQIFAQKQQLSQMIKDLEEIIKFIRKLLRCEVTGEVVGEFKLQGLDAKELREHSHHTNQYYGMSHFLPHYKQGEMVAYLNKLRTLTRQTELVAYKAFKDEYGKTSRGDIIKSLNRLSSLFWIMMVKYLTGKYSE